MLKWFQKKYPPRAQITLGEELTFVHGEENGKALIARFNAKAKALAGHPEYAHCATVAVTLNSPAANGLTQDEENTRLRDVEAQLRQCLEADNESLFVGAITTDGKKILYLLHRQSRWRHRQNYAPAKANPLA